MNVKKTWLDWDIGIPRGRIPHLETILKELEGVTDAQ